MPIIGLTKQASFPCLGIIRKGLPQGKKMITDKRTGEQREVTVPGKDLEHFRFEGSLPAYTEQFQSLYGDAPRSLQCWLPYAEVDANLDAWMEEYGGGGLKRRCDGETQVLHRDGSKMSQERLPCGAPACECKATCRLKIILPEFLRVGLVGYVLAVSTSKHDVMELSANLAQAYALSRNLAGIKFVLQRVPRKISVPTSDGRSRITKSLLSISPDPIWVTQQMGLREIEQGLTPTLAIAPADDEDDDFIPMQSGDYTQSELWQKVVGLFSRADTSDKIRQAEEWAYKQIKSNRLPVIARQGIERESKIAHEKLAIGLPITVDAIPVQG